MDQVAAWVFSASPRRPHAVLSKRREIWPAWAWGAKNEAVAWRSWACAVIAPVGNRGTDISARVRAKANVSSLAPRRGWERWHARQDARPHLLDAIPRRRDPRSMPTHLVDLKVSSGRAGRDCRGRMGVGFASTR